MTTRTIRTYSELKELKTLRERFEYLKLNGSVGNFTFGGDRWINQLLYNSDRWKKSRDIVIIRDDGCELGIKGVPIIGIIIVHHMVPITKEDILKERSWVFDPEYLISSSNNMHNAIHYGDERLIPETELVVRKKNDTCPWKK